MDTDGPDESQQLATDRGHHVLFTFTPRGQAPVAGVQPVLSFPRDRFHVGTDGCLALPQRGTHRRSVSTGPSGFDDDAPKMGIAGFRNPPAPGALAARMLTRHSPAVPHQLSRFDKARALADFADDRGRRDTGDPAQRLERLDDGAHPLRRRLDRLVNRVLKPLDTIGPVLDLVKVIQQRRLLRRVRGDN